MNEFIIINGLPYLYAKGKAYAVRWGEEGFTVGAEVKLASVPDVTYSELSITAKCAGNLDSIGGNKTIPEADKIEPPEYEKEADAGVSFDDMTLSELKEYAESHGIKLGSARTKAQIIAKINASAE